MRVSATNVVWLSPLLVCAFTMTLTVVLLEEVGTLEPRLARPPQPMALPPHATMAMNSVDSASSLRNSLRLLEEVQRSKGRSARAKGARESLAGFELALAAAV